MVSNAAVRSGLSWQSASLGVQVTLQLLVLGVLARVLEPKAFGLVAASYVAIDLCQLLSEAGASAAVIHRAQLDRDFVGTAWSTSIAIGVVLFVVLALLSAPVSAFLGIADLQPVLIALGGIFVLMGIGRVPEALLQRELRFAALMKLNLTSQIFGYALPAVILALAGFGVWALVSATLLQWAIKAGVLCLITRGHRPRFSQAALHEMLSFGLGITKEKIWNYVILQGDRFIVGRRLGADALGQYHVMAVALLPSRYFGDVIDNVFFPVMARMRDDRSRLIATWLSLVTNSYVFMFGVGIFLAANGEVVVRLAFGDRWVHAAEIFQWLCLGAGVRIVGRISDVVNRAMGHVHATARRKMITALLFVPLVWYGSAYGLVGVCVAVVTCQLVNAALQGSLAWLGLGLSWAQARTSVYRGLTGTIAVLVINGAFLWAGPFLEIEAWITLCGSALANTAAAFVLFRPLLRQWAERDRDESSGVFP